MANMSLDIGWRMLPLYWPDVPLSGVSTNEYGTHQYSLQDASGFFATRDRGNSASAEYINSPTLGVSGPGIAGSAARFNAGSRIQRVSERDLLTFGGSPRGVNLTVWVRPAVLQTGTIYAMFFGNPFLSFWGGWRLVLSNKFYNGSNMGDWYFRFDAYTVAGGIIYSKAGNAADPVVAGTWYHVVVTLNHDLNLEMNALYVNGVPSDIARNYSLDNTLAITTYRSISLADDDQRDGILSGTEGASRFVGDLALFGVNYGKVVNTSEGSDGTMPQARISRQYWRGATFGSPVMRPFQQSTITRIASPSNSLQRKLRLGR